MKYWKSVPWIVTALTICVATSTTVQARDSREDPALVNAVITQEIIEQIYHSGQMHAAQAPRLAEICPLLAPSS